MWICLHPHIPISGSIITPLRVHYLWEPWGWMLSTILGHSSELCVSFFCIGSLSSFHVSGRTYHRSIQTSYSSGTLLYGGYLASFRSQHVGRHSLLVSYCTKSCHWCFSRLITPGSAITVSNPGCSQICVLQRGVFFLSLSGSVRADWSVCGKSYQQC